jgi:BASS family bile acid:Na+ symporter
MPVMMVTGGVFHSWLGELGFLTPWLIFAMLFIPFCGVKPSELRLGRLHFALLAFQGTVGVAVYLAVRLFDPVLAQGAMICVVAPTATSAVVVAAMLGARVSTMLSYSLLINVCAAIGIPLFFSVITPESGMSFWASFVTILGRVIPVIVLPFVTSLLLRKFAPKVADGVQRLGRVSFYLWLVALAIVTARVVNFVATRSDLSLSRGLWLAGVALVICLGQFMAGKWLGHRYGERMAGGQALGQKNTILAIWLAQTYLNPLSSIAPAAYVLWQNIFNSVQLWRTAHKNNS